MHGTMNIKNYLILFFCYDPFCMKFDNLFSLCVLPPVLFLFSSNIHIISFEVTPFSLADSTVSEQPTAPLFTQKLQYTSIRVYGVTSQKKAMFICFCDNCIYHIYLVDCVSHISTVVF